MIQDLFYRQNQGLLMFIDSYPKRPCLYEKVILKETTLNSTYNPRRVWNNFNLTGGSPKQKITRICCERGNCKKPARSRKVVSILRRVQSRKTVIGFRKYSSLFR